MKSECLEANESKIDTSPNVLTTLTKKSSQRKFVVSSPAVLIAVEQFTMSF